MNNYKAREIVNVFPISTVDCASLFSLYSVATLRIINLSYWSQDHGLNVTNLFDKSERGVKSIRYNPCMILTGATGFRLVSEVLV